MEVNGWKIETIELKAQLAIALIQKKPIDDIVREIKMCLEELNDSEIEKGLVFHPIE